MPTARFVLVALARDSSRQIEHVEFGRRMTDQVGDVTESLAVLQTKGFSVAADGPILAVFAENPTCRRMGTSCPIAETGRGRGTAPSLTWHRNSLRQLNESTTIQGEI